MLSTMNLNQFPREMKLLNKRSRVASGGRAGSAAFTPLQRPK